MGELRLELISAFRSGAVQLPRFEPARLRFSLGSSLADLKIPYEITQDAERIFTWAGVQLVAMLVSRHRAQLTRGEFDRFLMDEQFSTLPEAAETLTASSNNADIRSTAEHAARAHPLLTGGVIAAWLGPGGGGRSLVALVIESLRGGIAEMRRCKGQEETPTLVALMLSTLVPQVDAAVARVPLSSPTDRPLRGAAMCGVFLAVKIGIDRALRDADLPAEVAMRIEAAFNPSMMLGGRTGMIASGATILGCELSVGIPWFDDLLNRMTGGASADVLQQELVRALAADKEISRRVETTAAASLMRERFIVAATLGDQGYLPRDLAVQLRDLVMYPSRLQSLLDDEKERKRFYKELPARAGATARTVEETVSTLVTALKKYEPKSPSAALGMEREEALRVYARSAVALMCDLWLDRALGAARRQLDRRTGFEAEGGNAAEYGAGRLYRLSIGGEPLLKDQIVSNVGHLFADVKDFTRRTGLVGGAAMGDLLRREFYAPVIEAAKKHYTGTSAIGGGSGITVNNLLGDAISLSGTITGLFSLATDLRRHLQQYERHLMREVSKEAVSRALQQIEEEYAKKLAQAPPGQEARVRGEKELALARARGEGLEAGVFISYGPAPIVITVSDEIFGESKVAIAEKINESARGTARSGGARSAADAELANERARRGDPTLQHPWSVFIGSPFTIQIPAATEQAVRAALSERDVVTAKRAVDGLVAIALESALRPEPDAPGDIYNNGIALSEEALLGFQQELGGKRIFRGVELHPATLHEQLRSRFYFGHSPMRLIAAYTSDGRPLELFRYAGRVMFKGFERTGGIRIWELASECLAGQLILHHHAAAWFKLQAAASSA